MLEEECSPAILLSATFFASKGLSGFGQCIEQFFNALDRAP
jgi:hypothetical protein